MVNRAGRWESQSVLVTGATGFIGQTLVKRLVTAGARVWAGVAPQDPPERVGALPAGVKRLTFDVRRGKAVAEAVEAAAPEVVFHLAAVGVTNAGVDPALALAVNAGGTINLLEAIHGQDVRRVLLTGTCYEYGAAADEETPEGLDPFNAYAASKVAAWAFGRMGWRAHGLPVVTVRPFQVYGPGQPAGSLVPAAIRAALTGSDFPMTPGAQTRDFIYVEDVANGMLAAATAEGIDGASLDLGSGTARPIRRVVERIWRMAGATGQLLPGALDYRPGEVMRVVADADRTARLTGWRAETSLDEGFHHTISYYEQL